MRSYVLTTFLAGALLSGCAAGTRLAGTPQPVTSAVKIPYRIQVSFQSKIPDDYYVMSGPTQTYQQVRFNDRFRGQLLRYVGDKSDPASARTLDLSVTLDDLSTAYDQIGLLNAVPRIRLASAGAPGQVELAAYGRVPRIRLADDFEREEGEDSGYPEEITKTARLRLTAVISEGGEVLKQAPLVAEVTDTWQRSYDEPAWAYDYDPVLASVIRDAIHKVNDLLDAAVAAK